MLLGSYIGAEVGVIDKGVTGVAVGLIRFGLIKDLAVGLGIGVYVGAGVYEVRECM